MQLDVLAISDDDWRWLRNRYGDFVLEEPEYAPKLLEIRDTLIGIEQLDRGEIVDHDVICHRAEAVIAMIKIGKMARKSG